MLIHWTDLVKAIEFQGFAYRHMGQPVAVLNLSRGGFVAGVFPHKRAGSKQRQGTVIVNANYGRQVWTVRSHRSSFGF